MKLFFIFILLFLLSGCTTVYNKIYTTGEINSCFDYNTTDDCIGCCLEIEESENTRFIQFRECQYICYKAIYNNKQNKEFIIGHIK